MKWSSDGIAEVEVMMSLKTDGIMKGLPKLNIYYESNNQTKS
jgi:hypothetical protein